MGISIADKRLLKMDAYIDGQWVASDQGTTLDVTNPATGEVIARVANCGIAETRRAIEAAQAAQVGWSKTPIKARSAILRKWFNLVTGRTAEIGKELTSNPTVRKLTFTGSTPVGKQLMAECAVTVKRTSMELGGIDK